MKCHEWLTYYSYPVIAVIPVVFALLLSILANVPKSHGELFKQQWKSVVWASNLRNRIWKSFPGEIAFDIGPFRKIGWTFGTRFTVVMVQCTANLLLLNLTCTSVKISFRNKLLMINSKASLVIIQIFFIQSAFLTCIKLCIISHDCWSICKK